MILFMYMSELHHINIGNLNQGKSFANSNWEDGDEFRVTDYHLLLFADLFSEADITGRREELRRFLKSIGGFMVYIADVYRRDTLDVAHLGYRSIEDQEFVAKALLGLKSKFDLLHVQVPPPVMILPKTSSVKPGMGYSIKHLSVLEPAESPDTFVFRGDYALDRSSIRYPSRRRPAYEQLELKFEAAA